MPPPPLTHHEILGLVEPFARSGWQVDLAASDRAARRIDFKPRLHAEPAATEALRLESLGTGSFKLTRTLTLDAAPRLRATLLASGDDPATLLACFDGVPLQRHVDRVGEVLIARSYQFESFVRGRSVADGSAVLLRHGEACVGGLQLALDLSMVRGVSAEITLTPADGGTLALPQDLLAVIGWDWARLVPQVRRLDQHGTRLRGAGQAPQPQAPSRRCAWTAPHATSASVLAEPPAALSPAASGWARWGVVLRRS